MKKTKLTWLARAAGVTLSLFLVLAMFAACPDKDNNTGGKPGDEEEEVIVAPYTLTINVNDPSLGGATVSGSGVTGNQSMSTETVMVHVNINNSSDYQLDSIFVNNGTTGISKMSEGQYEFVMPPKASTITVNFGVADSRTLLIKDFTDGHAGPYGLDPETGENNWNNPLFTAEFLDLGYWATGGGQWFEMEGGRQGQPILGYAFVVGSHGNPNDGWQGGGWGFDFSPAITIPEGYTKITIWLKIPGISPNDIEPSFAFSGFRPADTAFSATNTWIKISIPIASIYANRTVASFVCTVQADPMYGCEILFDSIRAEP